MHRTYASAVLGAALALWAAPALAQKPKTDKNDLGAALKKLKNPGKLELDMWAHEPELMNPVSFCFDGKGRMWVVETHRWTSSVFDIRGRMSWLDDDLACRTVADRDAMHKKFMGPGVSKITGESEIVRLLEDRNGVGKADYSQVFADGFDSMSDGIAAGVVYRDGNVYFADIPNLWKLRDTTGAGKADKKEAMFTGFGVHLAFLGHDLHGLIFGPDGKLYFSLGDRGANVKTADGRHIFMPDMGGVFRCNPDGTELEVIHVGLRNPQELAFDEFGNLFTCDNNCDNGDKARWVYIAEGGDSGWRIGYQHLPRAGPWLAEKIWELPQEAAYYRNPPLAYVAHGPSGLAFHPGVAGLPPRYDRHFFLANCPGNVLSFGVKRKGAGFEVTDLHEMLGSLWPSDVGFGPDGRFYVSDWVGEWGKNNKGRIFRMWDEAALKTPLVESTRKLLAEGVEGKGTADLVKMLAHPDMRVRQNAQYALAAKGEEAIGSLAAVAAKNENRLARVHAIWALGQIGVKSAKAVAGLPALLKDSDDEIRAVAAKVIGDRKLAAAFDGLIALLKDPAAHVRYHAGIALGKLGKKEAAPAVLEMVKENADKDALLRHAGVFALAGIGDLDALGKAGKDADRSVRLAALLAMRKLERPEVAGFLSDADPALAYEAARAINDVPINPALPALAALAGREKLDPRLASRVVNANFRLGTAESASALARFAGRSDLSEDARIDALKALATWEKPPLRDRVINLHRPLPARDAKPARDAMRLALAAIGKTTSNKLKAETAKTAATLGLKEATGDLAALVKSTDIEPAVRAEALSALAAQKDAPLAEAVAAALADTSDVLRREAVRLIPKAGLPDAAARLTTLSADKSVPVRQAAIGALGELPGAEADTVLDRLLGELAGGKLAANVQLDVLEAAGKRAADGIKAKLAAHEAGRSKTDHLAAWREALEGGDAATGRRIFYESAAVGCFKCHKVNGEGGEVGPSLSKIGAEKPREYLLESVALPNKQIAKGYEQVMILTNEDVTEVGRIENEAGDSVVLLRADGSRKTIKKADIAARKVGLSAMPDDIVKKMTKRELRDVVEFLSTLKEEKAIGHGK